MTLAMSSLTVGALVLRARIALARHGGPVLAAALLLAGAGACLVLLPTLRAEVAARGQDVRLLQERAAVARANPVHDAPPPPPSERNAQDFYAALGDVRLAEHDLQVLFDEAQDQGLRIEQADYKLGYDANGRFYIYTVQMPVSGSYAAIRDFCRQLLRAVPYAALDDISLRRGTTGDGGVEARLRLTFYLDGPPDYAAGIAGTFNHGTPRGSTPISAAPAGQTPPAGDAP